MMFGYKWCSLCSLVALLSAFSSMAAAAAAAVHNTRIVVDPSDQGCFTTIQSAIDSIPLNNQNWTRIHIKSGVYWEQVVIPREKPFIYLKGEGKRNTFLMWNGFDNIVTGATFASEADNTLAKGITFLNSYNSRNQKPMARAVAAMIQGDKSGFHRCGFFSLQDTLWDVGGRHYFKGCTIYGAVDFIFGAGQSLYESCTISVAGLDGITGFITAQGRGVAHDRSGFVFKHCRIVGKGKAYLGRPWRPYARVLFYNTSMSEAVVPQGWGLFDKSTSLSQLTMSELNSQGPGATSEERVKWAKKMSEKEARRLASTSFIDDEGWVKIAFQIFNS